MVDEMEHDPSHRGVMPPPLPKRSSAWRIVLLFAGGVLALAAIPAAAWFGWMKLGTRVIEVNGDQRAALHRAADLHEWYPFLVDESCETWTGERMFDGAVELAYEYDDPRDQAPYMNASLHCEPALSDAVAMFAVLWQSAKLGVRISGTGIRVEEQHDLFHWGDASRLAYLTNDSGRNGMIFCARKDRRIYLLMTSGAVLEDAEELAAFLRPKLEAASTVPIEGVKP